MRNYRWPNIRTVCVQIYQMLRNPFFRMKHQNAKEDILFHPTFQAVPFQTSFSPKLNASPIAMSILLV